MSEVSKGYSLTHCHKFYKEKTGDKLSIREYRDICCAFNKAVTEELLTGRPVHLPHSMGVMWIKKVKTNWEKLKVNFQETKKLGSTVYHDNSHSDGWWGRWNWTKYNKSTTNSIYYVFTPTRKNSRLISAAFKEKGGHKRFFSQI